MSKDDSSGFGCLLLIIGLSLMYCWSDSGESSAEPQTSSEQLVYPNQGDASMSGGSATVREPYLQLEDDPSTTNDESNDQPLGHYGTLTLNVCNQNSGNCYDLDADLDGFEMTRLYFSNGGWVDFSGCELDEDYEGFCEDENGTAWEIRGE